MKRLAVLLALALALGPLLAGPLWAGSAHRGGGNGMFSGNATAPITGNALWHPDTEWTTPSLDNAPGVPDNSGADPNPYPGDTRSTIQMGVLSSPFTYMVDPIHVISAFNGPPDGTPASDLYSVSYNIEYGYDNTVRSMGGDVERYMQITPNTFRITFNPGANNLLLGENYTFTNGAVCRPTKQVAMGVGAVARMMCTTVAGVATPPAVGNTITGCSGTVCTATGTVSAVYHQIDSFRPEFSAWFPGTNSVDWWIQSQGIEASGACADPPDAKCPQYWISAQSGDGVIHIGHSGYTEPGNRQHRMSIPFDDNTNFDGLVIAKGDIAVNTTHDAAAGGVPRLEFASETSSTWAAPFFGRYALSPVTTSCYQKANLTLGNDQNFPLAPYQPVTYVAFACRDDSNAAPGTPATLQFETPAGDNNITTSPASVTCVGNATAMSWATTTDADAAIASGGVLRFDVTNTPTAAALTTICVAYVATRQGL